MTSTAKPKPKFSSRNLSAVFKAPLRTKPLPDNATGPLPRNGGRLMVLGRAGVAPPAPVNTPSRRKESQALESPVSLVPAASNWATNAAVLTENAPQTPSPEHKQMEYDAVQPTAAPADPVVHASAPEKAWTPESVAEHLHTHTSVQPPIVGNNCGRWGDDAVERDIVQKNLQRQVQKERDFPDLKEAVEEAHEHRGHAPAAGSVSPLMGPQQHHGRAMGRWAHFNEQEAMRRPMQDDRWSRDRFSRDEDDRWSRDRYHQEDDRWSSDRYSRSDDEYGRDSRSYEPTRGSRMVSPIPNDSRTHFSSSDARFDKVASGERVLSYSPHRMDWSRGASVRRDDRSSSPAPPYGPGGSRLHDPLVRRSVTLSPAAASPSPSPATPTLTAAVAPARAMGWRHLPDKSDHARESSPQATNAQSTTEQDGPSIPLAGTAASNTESSSCSSSASSSPSPAQQVQLLTRPKMLFDPKTGGMVNAANAAASGKRPASGRTGGKGRGTVDATVASDSSAAVQSRMITKTKAASDRQVEVAKEVSARKPNEISKEKVVDSALIVPAEDASFDCETSFSDVLVAEQSVRKSIDLIKTTANRVISRQKQTTVGTRTAQQAQRLQNSQKKTGGDQPANSSTRSSDAKTTERRKWTRGEKRPKDVLSKRTNQRVKRAAQLPVETESKEMLEPKVSEIEVALLKEMAEGSGGGVVVVTGVQEGIEVKSEDGEFETVKSRRAVLSEKKKLRQRRESAEAAAQVSKQSVRKVKQSTRVSPNADEQSKGEEVQVNFEIDSSRPSTKTKSKMASKSSKKSTEQGTESSNGKDRSSTRSASKQTSEISDFKKGNQSKSEGSVVDNSSRKARIVKQKSAKARDDTKQRYAAGNDKQASRRAANHSDSSLENKSLGSPASPTEQVAGEAAMESKKHSHSVKATPSAEAKREQKSWVEKRMGQKMRASSRMPNDRKTAESRRNQERSDQQRPKRMSGKEEGSVDRIVAKFETDVSAAATAMVCAENPSATTSATKRKVVAKSRGASSKARPKQVKQVYVVKTPAPVAASATSTAA